MTEHFLSSISAAEYAGISAQAMSYRLKSYPLPPAVKISGSTRHGTGYTKEQIDWYMQAWKNRKLTSWKTPWDDKAPTQYVGAKEIITRAGRKYAGAWVGRIGSRYGIEPDIKVNLVKGWTPENAGRLVEIISNARAPGGTPHDTGLLNKPGIAKMLGVSRDTVYDYKLPKPDFEVMTGAEVMPVWWTTTIQRWHKSRRHLQKTRDIDFD